MELTLNGNWICGLSWLQTLEVTSPSRISMNVKIKKMKMKNLQASIRKARIKIKKLEKIE
ncbi:hypothetical protein HanIR_Chr03g0144191 [Helianthus annuus]|nr:hypothetical protein HanIR_Chr03g0144191 [Helianthus annuus]